jgi:hypothetical protein
VVQCVLLVLSSSLLVSLFPRRSLPFSQVITGAAGNLEGRAPLGNTSNFPDYVAWASDAYYGFSLLKFIDRQHIEVQFIRSDNGDLLDSATLYKEH